MNEALDFDAFEREVMRQANDLTPELLPRLLIQLLKRDSLVFCERHMRLLFSYIRAQINLTRAKRNYYRYGEWKPLINEDAHNCDGHCQHLEDMSETAYRMATIERDNIRRIYRSTPCVCFQTHR